jgi:hypothetical protein
LSTSLPCPVGVPLTDVMEFTAGDHSCWLVYIETIDSPPPRRWWPRTVLPARRLRFDSISESRATTPVPAGSPFLTETRLQRLLDRAVPVELCDAGPSAGPDRRRPAQATARAAGLAAATVASVALAEGGRRWRKAAERRRTLRSRTLGLAAGAADRLTVWVAGLLKGRPSARL